MKITHLAFSGLATIDGRPWVRVKCRKVGVCAETGMRYRAGTLVYRPLGNGRDRMLRVRASVVEG